MEAVGRLGRYKANSDETFSVGEFKAQEGVIANIEYYGDMTAQCKVLGYEMIRISKRNEVNRVTNQEARFEGHSREIVSKAAAGDLYIFKNIKYRCPSAAKPQRLDDMIFEIK